MKKTFKILGVTALIAAIMFSMTACKEQEENYPDPPKQFIEVTDIPSAYNNKYGIILLNPSDIYSALEKINSTSTSFPLYTKDDPWEGSGNFSVTILIFENASDTQRKYQGVTAEMPIAGNTVIPWSSFTPK